MSHLSPALRILVLVALASLPFANGAEAGLADNAGSALSSFGRFSPAQRVQYYSFDGDNYCWYDDGWNGPGWYWCGDEWYSDYGWGGPYGWNGWGGGYLIRRHGRHGVGVWHSGAPKVYRSVAPSHGLRAGGAGQFPLPSGALGRRNLGHGPGASSGLGAGGVRVAPGFPAGGAPVSPGFTGSDPMGVAAAVFIGSAARELRVSTRLLHVVLLAAAVFTDLAGAEASGAVAARSWAATAAAIAERPPALSASSSKTIRSAIKNSRPAHQLGDAVAVVEPREENCEKQVEQAEPDEAAADREPDGAPRDKGWLGEGVPGPPQERLTRVKAALDPLG